MVGVLVVSDIRFYREGLQRALSVEVGLEIVGTAADAHEALDIVRRRQADMTLLDFSLRNGLSLVAAIHQVNSAARVVAIGLPESGNAILPWAEAGVAGYVSRDCSLAGLVTVVHTIANGGGPPCTPQVSAALFRRVATLARSPSPGGPARLTARETEIAALLARGLSNRDIARRLAIALPTVKNHVHNVLDKLGVQSRAEVAEEFRLLTVK